MELPISGADVDPAWTVAVDGDPRPGRIAETLLTSRRAASAPAGRGKPTAMAPRR